MMAGEALDVHQFWSDGIADHRGETRCTAAGCGMPRRHPVHDLPPNPPAAAEIEARVLGEGNDVYWPVEVHSAEWVQEANDAIRAIQRIRELCSSVAADALISATARAAYRRVLDEIDGPVDYGHR